MRQAGLSLSLSHTHRKYLVGLCKQRSLLGKRLFLLMSFLVAPFLLSDSEQVSIFIVQAFPKATKEKKVISIQVSWCRYTSVGGGKNRAEKKNQPGCNYRRCTGTAEDSAARGECCSCVGHRSGNLPLTPASLAQNLTPAFSGPSGHLWVCVNTHKHMHMHTLQNKKRGKGKWVGHANQAGPGLHTSNPTTEAETEEGHKFKTILVYRQKSKGLFSNEKSPKQHLLHSPLGVS